MCGVISTAGGILNLVLSANFPIGFGYYGWAKTEAASTSPLESYPFTAPAVSPPT